MPDRKRRPDPELMKREEQRFERAQREKEELRRKLVELRKQRKTAS